MVLRVGLTGGIASGKSVVAMLWREAGVPVIDADALAHRAIEPRQPAHDEVVAAFGPSILTPEGLIDRKALGRIVFADAEARARLEAIVHPRVTEAIERELDLLEQRGEPIGVCEVPLLFEAGLAGLFDQVVVVAARDATQRERLMERDGLTRPEAEARLASQWPTERKVAAADEVIWNDGSLADLRRAAADTLERLAARAKGKEQ